jgi:hypothetical protein
MGVSTAVWKGRTNNNKPEAANTTTVQRKGTPKTMLAGHQSRPSASRLNGAIATTGTNAQIADRSTLRAPRDRAIKMLMIEILCELELTESRNSPFVFASTFRVVSGGGTVYDS